MVFAYSVGVTSAPAPLVRVLSEIEDLTKPRLVIRIKLATAAEDRDNGDEPKSVHTLALIDTGATRTCVCAEYLAKIGADSWYPAFQIGVGGLRKCYTHFADLSLLGNDKVEFAQFASVEVIDFEPSEHDNIKVLLGMDVLGRFSEIRLRGFELDFGTVLA